MLKRDSGWGQGGDKGGVAHLREEIFSQVDQLSQITASARQRMQGYLSDEDLLSGLMFHWEQV